MKSILTSRAVASGIFCIALGAYVVWHAQGYAFGTIRAMGPGFAPTVLGIMLTGIGIAMVANVIWDRSTIDEINLRPLIMIILAVVVFAMTITRLGLIPAVVLTVGVAGLSDRTTRPLLLGLVTLGLLVLVWVVFIRILGMQIPLFRWRF